MRRSSRSCPCDWRTSRRRPRLSRTSTSSLSRLQTSSQSWSVTTVWHPPPPPTWTMTSRRCAWRLTPPRMRSPPRRRGPLLSDPISSRASGRWRLTSPRLRARRRRLRKLAPWSSAEPPRQVPSSRRPASPSRSYPRSPNEGETSSSRLRLLPLPPRVRLPRSKSSSPTPPPEPATWRVYASSRCSCPRCSPRRRRTYSRRG
mmetsp:Transcript_5063/g.22626  ORF Transcript_5063/g.22626 Transcript_5063/m.22626 type:complete len:202 (+) Transcript_5063:611-1216(+)